MGAMFKAAYIMVNTYYIRRVETTSRRAGFARGFLKNE